MKRVLVFLGILAGVGLLLLAGYFLRYRQQAAAPAGTGGTLTGSLPDLPGQSSGGGLKAEDGLVLNSEQKFGAVAASRIAAYYVNPDDSILAVEPDGAVVRLTKGRREVLNQPASGDLASASFSSDGRYLVAGFRSGTRTRYSVFDLSLKTWRPLEDGVMSPAWSPVDGRLAYYSLTAHGLYSLNAADPKSKPVLLARIALAGISLAWPATDKLILTEQPSAYYDGSEWSFSIKSKAFSSLSSNVRGGQNIWNFTGAKGLQFTGGRGERGGLLSLVNDSGRVQKELTFTTLPSKCAFFAAPTPAAAPATSTSKKATSTAPIVNELLFCGVPRDTLLFSRAALPDDYEKGLLKTADEIFGIDLASGRVDALLSDPALSLDAQKLQIKNGRLYFVNRLDGRLYSLALN